MKNLLACLAILAAFCANAQVNDFQLPYNPDSEPDGYIGINDLLGFLPHFASEFDVDSANWVGQLLEQSEALSTEIEALSDSLTNALTANDELTETVDSLAQYPDSLSWALNRDACKVSMSSGWSYEVGINCQYDFVAIPNSGGWSSNTFLRLPEEVPFEDYSVHVHVNKSGVIACGTNGTGCPQVYVQVHQ